jgi:hypothetical protein
VRFSSPTRRAAGLLAVTTIGLSTAVLSVTGVASAAPLESFTIPATGQSGSVTVPDGYCAVTWTLLGAQGGADFLRTPGEKGDELGITTEVGAGYQISWTPGGVGGDAADITTPGTAGTGGTDAAGEAGAAGTGGGGGGGASIVTIDAADHHNFLVAKGGDGAGAGGGPGGSQGSTFLQGQGELIDRTDVNSGAGSVAGVGVPCSAPPAPDVQLTDSTVTEDSITVRFFAPTTTYDDGRRAQDEAGTPYQDVSGYEVSVDGGAWTSITPVAGTGEDQALYATVNGFQSRTEHTVQLRATSIVGPSAGSGVVTVTTTPRTLPGAATAGLKAGVQSLTFQWTPPADTTALTGYTMEAYLQYDEDVDPATFPEDIDSVLTCDAPATATSCTVLAAAGYSYSGYVQALYGEDHGDYTDTGVSALVSAPAAPSATLPKADGTLASSDADGKVVAGEQITISGKDFLPGSTVDLVVYSTPVKLGTATVLADGTFSATVTLPKDLTNGTHHLVASGVDVNGNPRVLVVEVTVSGGTAVLAYTGFSALPAAGAGALALIAGGGLLVVSRRRQAA